jgi:hypothetical protein
MISPETILRLQQAADMAEALWDFTGYAADRAGSSEQASDFHCAKYVADGILQAIVAVRDQLEGGAA